MWTGKGIVCAAASPHPQWYTRARNNDGQQRYAR
jgi:hypothetical protein